jgi:hypothetical protein
VKHDTPSSASFAPETQTLFLQMKNAKRFLPIDMNRTGNRLYASAIAIVVFSVNCFGQSGQVYNASFIGCMGVDTVLIETYSMINNHLYGKAFVRVPRITLQNSVSIFTRREA